MEGWAYFWGWAYFQEATVFDIENKRTFSYDSSAADETRPYTQKIKLIGYACPVIYVRFLAALWCLLEKC